MKKSTQSCLIIIGLLVFSVSTLTTAYAASSEYFCLTVRGDSMAPAIREGDAVRVRLCVSGSLVTVGDIIVYCTIVIPDPHPDAMWIGHRVIEKYRKDSNWWLRARTIINRITKKREGSGLFLLSILDIDN